MSLLDARSCAFCVIRGFRCEDGRASASAVTMHRQGSLSAASAEIAGWFRIHSFASQLQAQGKH